MNGIFTVPNITFGVGMLAIVFSVFSYFKDPQTKEEQKAALLDQQVNFSNESVDRRFKEQQDNYTQLLLQSNNHIHTIDTKVEALSGMVGALNVKIATLSTIIDARIPKKTQ